jgi:hypothetical protein
MIPLDEYEAAQADEIAAWKAERPSLLMAAFRGISRPISRLASKVVSESTVRTLVERAEHLSEKFGGQEEIARRAGVRDIRDLRIRTLRECDGLAATVSAPAERQAMIEGAVAGLGGVITETVNVPVLLAATLRSIARIGHCYGYPLDTEIDRVFVLGILELSTADDPARRLELFRQLRDLTAGTPKAGTNGKPLSLDGVSSAMFEDLAFGAVPILGDVTSILMDYDFVRRVDITARRVFQERWLVDRGKLDEVFPSPESRRRSSLEGGADLLAQIAYVGAYGAAFGITLPLAVIARGAQSYDNSLVRGCKQGARHAAEDAGQFLDRIGTGRSRATGSTSATLPVVPAAHA